MWATGPATLPATVELDGQVYTLREASTAELFGWIAAGNWLAIFPGLLDDADAEALARRINSLDDPTDYADLYEVATVAAARLAGAIWSATDKSEPAPSWPGALRLLHTAAARWVKFEGWCVSHGYEPLAGPLWRITAAAYQWLYERWDATSDPKRKAVDLQRLDTSIWLTPLTPTAVTSAPALARHTVDQERAAARAMLAEIRGGVPPA